MIKVYSISLGCPKNRVDTERLLGVFRSGGGVEPVDEPAMADLVLVNTCGFIEPAVEESVRTVLENARAVEEAQGKRPLLAVAGCLVSRYGAGELGREIPEVDIWLSTRDMERWPGMLAEKMPGFRREGVVFGARQAEAGAGFAYLKVGEGCGHDCAFCTIPSIRGRAVSDPLPKLLEEAGELVAGGVKEIILVAQDVTSYGKDLGADGPGLVELVDGLARLEGLAWLRLMYLYPAGLTEPVLDFLAEHALDPASPVLPYFDVPLQHSHPDILKAMGRPFARDPRRVLDRIRTRMPDAAVRTSLIVGFPGEGEEEFAHLREFVSQARFHHLGVFPYWPEEGTRAAALSGGVAKDVRLARRGEIMALQAEISEEILERYLGEALSVLVGGEHPEWPGLYLGRAWFQAPEVDGITYVSGPGTASGRMVAASVEETKTYDLVALSEQT